MKKDRKTTEYLTSYADELPDKDTTLRAARKALTEKTADKKSARKKAWAIWVPVGTCLAAVAVAVVFGLSAFVRSIGADSPSSTEKPAAPIRTYYTTAEIGYRTVDVARAAALSGLDLTDGNAECRLYQFKADGGDAVLQVKMRFFTETGCDEVTLFVELNEEKRYRTLAEQFARTGTVYENGEWITRSAFENGRIYVQVMSPDREAADRYLPSAP